MMRILIFLSLVLSGIGKQVCESCSGAGCVAECGEGMDCTCATCSGVGCKAICSKQNCDLVTCDQDKCMANCGSVATTNQIKCGTVKATGEQSFASCTGGSKCDSLSCVGDGCSVSAQRDGVVKQEASCVGDHCRVDCSKNAKCFIAKCIGKECLVSCEKTSLSGKCDNVICDGIGCSIFCTMGKCTQMLAKGKDSSVSCNAGVCGVGKCIGPGCGVICGSCSSICVCREGGSNCSCLAP